MFCAILQRWYYISVKIHVTFCFSYSSCCNHFHFLACLSNFHKCISYFHFCILFPPYVLDFCTHFTFTFFFTFHISSTDVYKLSLLFSILPPRLLMFMIILLLLSLSIFNFTPSAADGYAHFTFYFQFYLLIPWCLMFMPI